jgi:hypothetical protein
LPAGRHARETRDFKEGVRGGNPVSPTIKKGPRLRLPGAFLFFDQTCGHTRLRELRGLTLRPSQSLSLVARVCGSHPRLTWILRSGRTIEAMSKSVK